MKQKLHLERVLQSERVVIRGVKVTLYYVVIKNKKFYVMFAGNHNIPGINELPLLRLQGKGTFLVLPGHSTGYNDVKTVYVRLIIKDTMKLK